MISPPGAENRSVVDEVILKDSTWELMDYSNPELDRLFYADVEADFIAPTIGSYEVALAVLGSGNVYVDEKLVVENTKTQRQGNFCFGRGTVEEKAIVELVKGCQYRLKVEFASAPSSKLVTPGVVSLGHGAGRLGLIELVDEDLLIARAADAAKDADVAILCAGLTGDFESEGFDRPHMDLPGVLTKLISAVLAVVPDTIIVTQSGTPFNMLPWADSVETPVILPSAHRGYTCLSQFWE